MRPTGNINYAPSGEREAGGGSETVVRVQAGAHKVQAEPGLLHGGMYGPRLQNGAVHPSRTDSCSRHRGLEREEGEACLTGDRRT